MSSCKKHIYFLILLLVPGYSIWGQTDKVKKYRYQFCVSHTSTEKSSVQKNAVIGIAYTTIALIRGYVHDYNNNPIMAASIVFYNQKDSLVKGCYSDSLGFFSLSLLANTYKVDITSIGFSPFIVNQFQPGTGEIRELEFQLGMLSGISTYLIESEKKLSKKELKKLQEQYESKN
ncbi:MAG: carboxypeptidase regulatory-like domain-containing protein [Ferruginibacter sp.]|nr:carboxypeptidase regulatory-like domain-containing protein [Chitinophagaceae bacterium]